jgi:uracil-DNA glycosylase
MFRAFESASPKEVRVVILGQDPYHTPAVADGLAFSSFSTNPIPPSLLNIYKEIEAEFHTPCAHTPDLSHWAEQGVLLLNASLTVESGKANSHAAFGWHEFTDAVIESVSRECTHVVFLLWGNYAREKRTLIDATKHLILESPHPSPLSAHRGFLGNNHFKKANEYLEKHGRGTISWC